MKSAQLPRLKIAGNSATRCRRRSSGRTHPFARAKHAGCHRVKWPVTARLIRWDPRRPGATQWNGSDKATRRIYRRRAWPGNGVAAEIYKRATRSVERSGGVGRLITERKRFGQRLRARRRGTLDRIGKKTLRLKLSSKMTEIELGSSASDQSWINFVRLRSLTFASIRDLASANSASIASDKPQSARSVESSRESRIKKPAATFINHPDW